MSDDPTVPTDRNGLDFRQVQAIFDRLGVANFGAALPEGRIHWTDQAGGVVAHARCQAILSWAATNQSLMWAEAIAGFKDAGVPCLPKPDERDDYEADIDEDTAQELAGQCAQLTGAQFLYAAPTGGGGKLFLAVRDFRPGGLEPDPEEEARRVEAARGWAEGKLTRLAEALADEARTGEVAGLLRAFAGEARQQAHYVVQGTALGGRLGGLATQAEAWAAALPQQREVVAYQLGVAAKGLGVGEA
ncbi:MAG: hypothetical protein H6742_13575 [Alphaproteobacteria bacterium]|nr:hypothetical protein [Alphaproteobacteria bacterium]